MELKPITRRPARWISFALAVMLALQFVSPMVNAAEQPRVQSVFALTDSTGSGESGETVSSENMPEDELEPEGDLEPEVDFKQTLDSMPVLDSTLLRAPTVGPSWCANTRIEASVYDAKGTEHILDSIGSASYIPLDKTAGNAVNKLKLKISVAIPNRAEGEEFDISTKYKVTFDDSIVSAGTQQQTGFGTTNGTNMFKWTLTPASPPTLEFEALDIVKTLSDVTGIMDVTLNLNPLADANPSDPKKVPIISENGSAKFEIYPIDVERDPSVKKLGGDVSGVGPAPHLIKWSVEVRTGRRTPAAAPGYTERSITLVDTPVANQSFFGYDKETNSVPLNVEWTDNSETTPAPVTVPLSTGENDTTIPRYEISPDNKTLTVHLPDVPDNKDKPHLLTYSTYVDPTYFSSNQGTTLTNKAQLVAGGKTPVNTSNTAKLPTWLEKTNTTLVDADKIPRNEMAIAWVITVNPGEGKVTIPQGAKLTDLLPPGLNQIVSVCELNADGSTIKQRLYLPDVIDSNPITANWTLDAGGTSGTLNPSGNPYSGVLSYTYPQDEDLTGTDPNKGIKQQFLVTALVDLTAIGGSSDVPKYFTNEAKLDLAGGNGGYGAAAPKVGVGVDYALLDKSGVFDKKDRIITWTIHFNNIQKSIARPILKDKYGQEVQVYVPESFAVYPGKTATGTPYMGGAFAENVDKDGWTYNFNLESTSDAYTIVYKTYLKHASAYPTKETATNTVELFENETLRTVDPASVDCTVKPVTKEIASYDPITRKIKWKVVVNEDGAFLENPSFEDVLPKFPTAPGKPDDQLRYVEGSFQVQRNNEAIQTEPSDFNHTNGKLTYNFLPLKAATPSSTVYYYKPGAPVQGVKTTDAKGVCSWDKLAEGEYYIEETAAPEGYTLSDVTKSVTFEISRSTLPKDTVLADTDNATADGEYLVNAAGTAWKTPAFVFEFSNARIGSVGVEKHDTATNAPLTGAQFGLYKQGEALPMEAKLTGADGKLTFDARLADKTTYEVREQLAPEGYLLGGYSKTFTIDFASGDANQRKYAFTAGNTKNLVACEKTDNANPDKKLAGAVFGLYRADGTLIFTATSGENGRFLFTGVPAGAYIQEITPPNGYQLDTQTRYIPGLNAASAENPPLYTFKNMPTPSNGGSDGGGGGGGTPLLSPKHPGSSSSSSSGAGSNSGADGSSSSRPWPPIEDEYGHIFPEGMTSDEVGRLLDEGYRPTRDVPFGLTREQVVKMILDENIPLGRLPATGDAAGRVVFPLVLMGISSAGISYWIISKRKKRKLA